MKTGFSEAGLSAIDTEISKLFLSLRPCPAPNRVSSEIVTDYLRLIEAFEYLCNLNLRDREIARGITNTLEDSSLQRAFPDVLVALRLWGAGDLAGARSCFRKHVEIYPTDFVSFFMLHMFDFLHGRPDRYSEYLIADARCDHPIFGGYYKGVVSFSLCEQGDIKTAYRYALEACDREQLDDIYSIHALVHCWHGMGDHESIVGFLRTREHDWYENEGMNMHVNWHLATSLLYMGKTKEAVRAYHQFRSLSRGHHAEQDLDAVNFCIRLFLTTVPRPEFFVEYQTLARNWAPSIYNSLSYFNDAHAAIAFMLADDKALMQKLLNRPEISVLDARTRNVGECVLHAINEFMHENYDGCIEKLESTRPDWHLIGGSYAQREILDVIVNVARELQGGGRVRALSS